MTREILACAIVLTASLAAPAQEKASKAYPPDLPGAKVETYKTVGDVKLKLYMYEPAGHKPTDKTPAIVFFISSSEAPGFTSKLELQTTREPAFLSCTSTLET